ncbi:hypothetical protein BDR07DRAFT_1483399 [Suillus spraguei]|nr:hypothetical protein BDR07DRAFT_1483399 [Suillus spraguei]
MPGSLEDRYIGFKGESPSKHAFRHPHSLSTVINAGQWRIVGKLSTSCDEPLDRGDEPFDISFPSVRGVHLSLTLKATILRDCDNQDSALFDSISGCQITRDTDVGHAQFARYMASKMVSYLNNAVQHFQLVLDQCPVGYPHQAAALTDPTWACLKSQVQKNFQDMVFITSLFRKTLSRPQGHPDHPLSIYHLTSALTWHYSKEHTAVYIHESA